MLTGGKLLDTGTYSCIFDPPLRCKQGSKIKTPGRMISKLMVHEEAEAEWDISEKIRKIPLWKNYFAVSESICNLGPKQTDIDLYMKCDVMKKTAPEELRILQMPFAGKQLSNFSIPPSFNVKAFMIHVLESGALLLQYNIVHFDLHAGNILIDSHSIPRMIDFNLSMMADSSITLSHLSYRYSGNFHLVQQPPDYSALIGINQHKDINRIVHNINDKRIIKDVKMLLHVPSNKILSDLIRICTKNAMIRKGDILGWFNKHWTTIDSWAVGTYFITMLKSHSMTPHLYHSFRSHYHTFKKVLSSLCAIDPEERWDCMQALYFLNPNSTIIKKYGKKWLDTHGYPK